MKRTLLPVTVLTALLAAGTLGAAPSNNAAAAAAKPTKLLKIATIHGADANREFQNNVRILQAQREEAQALNAAYEKETNTDKKKELKAKLDAAMKKLNDSNALMTKAYGFSLSRDYVMEIETSNIYMTVTDEEAAKIEQAQKAQQTKK